MAATNWEQFLPYIKFQASRFSSTTRIPEADFYQAGVLGALEAIRQIDEVLYSHSQVVRYVKTYIWHYMLKEIRELQHAVYIPLHLNRRINSGEVKFSITGEECLEIGSLHPMKIGSDPDNKQHKVHPDFVVSGNETVRNCHYRGLFYNCLCAMKGNNQLNDVEIVCYLLYNGLFDFPKLTVEQIGKILSLSANTISKKVLKASGIVKRALLEQYDAEAVFV